MEIPGGGFDFYIPAAPKAENYLLTKVNPFSWAASASNIPLACSLMNVYRGPQVEILHAPLGQSPGNLSRADESYICPPRLSQFVCPEKKKKKITLKKMSNFKAEVVFFHYCEIFSIKGYLSPFADCIPLCLLKIRSPMFPLS